MNIQTSLSFPQCSSNNSRFSAYRSLWKPLRRWFLLKIPAFTFRSTLKDKMKGFRGKWGTIVKRNSIHFDFFPVTYLYPLSLFSTKHTYINVHFLLRHIYIHSHFLLTHVFSTFTFYHNISISTITFNYNILPWIVFTFTKISLSAICILLSWLFAVWNYCNFIFENLVRFLSWKKHQTNLSSFLCLLSSPFWFLTKRFLLWFSSTSNMHIFKYIQLLQQETLFAGASAYAA